MPRAFLAAISIFARLAIPLLALAPAVRSAETVADIEQQAERAAQCYDLSLCLAAQQKFADALPYSQRAEAGFPKNHGAQHPYSRRARRARERIEAASVAEISEGPKPWWTPVTKIAEQPKKWWAAAGQLAEQPRHWWSSAVDFATRKSKKPAP